MKILSSQSPVQTGRYLKSEKFFFTSSKLFAAQITELFDFVWPTATAMWNLRWQVAGYLREREDHATIEEIHRKFGSASAIIAPNYYRACVESTWEQQQEQFARFLLTNAFALYESWLGKVLADLNQSSFEKQLQFPSLRSRPSGVLEAIQTICTPESLVLRNSFYPIFSAKPKFCLAELNNLMICYRYFKEMRNAFMHSGGEVHDGLENASRNYESVSELDLKAKEKPAFSPLRKNGAVEIHLRGVVGFLDILLKIVTTLDAELLRSESAETYFESVLREEIPKAKILNRNLQRRKGQIGSLIRKIGLARPVANPDLENWLIEKRFIAFG